MIEYLADVADRIMRSPLAFIRFLACVFVGCTVVCSAVAVEFRPAVEVWLGICAALPIVVTIVLITAHHVSTARGNDPFMHWGSHPGHGGLTQHTGARRRCPAPECGPDGRSWADRLHVYRMPLVMYACLFFALALAYSFSEVWWLEPVTYGAGGVLLAFTAFVHVRLWRGRRDLY